MQSRSTEWLETIAVTLFCVVAVTAAYRSVGQGSAFKVEHATVTRRAQLHAAQRHDSAADLAIRDMLLHD